MTVIQWLKSLGCALPLSQIKEKNGSFRQMSNSDLRRLCEQKAVLINGNYVDPSQEIDFPVFSLVFYPKSKSKRVTLF